MASVPSTSNDNVSLNMDHVSPVTRLLAKRKMMLNVQQSLDAQKSACMQREEVFRKREESQRRKDIELQESLVQFDKFLKENEYKRQRAELKAAEEAEKRRKWEHEIQLKQAQQQVLQDRLVEKRQQYQRYQPYVNYFGKVMEVYNNGNSESAENILGRYQTLKRTVAALEVRHARSSTTSDDLRKKHQATQSSIQSNSLLMNNLISRENRQLDVQSTNIVDAQEAAEHSRKFVIDLHKKLARVTMSINNLYQRCCKVVLIPGEKACHIQHYLRRLPPINESDLHEGDGPIIDATAVEAYLRTQQEVIQTYIHDFHYILTELKQRVKNSKIQ